MSTKSLPKIMTARQLKYAITVCTVSSVFFAVMLITYMGVALAILPPYAGLLVLAGAIMGYVLRLLGQARTIYQDLLDNYQDLTKQHHDEDVQAELQRILKGADIPYGNPNNN